MNSILLGLASLAVLVVTNALVHAWWHTPLAEHALLWMQRHLGLGLEAAMDTDLLVAVLVCLPFAAWATAFTIGTCCGLNRHFRGPSPGVRPDTNRGITSARLCGMATSVLAVAILLFSCFATRRAEGAFGDAANVDNDAEFALSLLAALVVSVAAALAFQALHRRRTAGRRAVSLNAPDSPGR